MTYTLNAGTPKAWDVLFQGVDTALTRPAIVDGHYQDTLFDGQTTATLTRYTQPFSHTLYASASLSPQTSADISGGKMLHLTAEVDRHLDQVSRWLSFELAPATDPLTTFRADDALFGGNTNANVTAVNARNQALWVQVIAGSCDATLLEGPRSTTDPRPLAKTFVSFYPATFMSPQCYQPLNWGDNGRGLDNRSRLDLFVTTQHLALFEDGVLLTQADLPDGGLPFSQAKVYFTHYLFNTAGESRQLQRTAPYETYWLNSFPHSDERHWDNVGFEVLPSVAVPATNDFSSLAALIHLPALTAPAFVIPLAPTPTPVPSVTSTPLPSNVPAAYSSQYASIMAALTIFKGKLDAQPAPQGNTPVFGAGLALANGQQGTALLNRYAIVGVQQELDHLKALGVQGVTLSLTYPLLTPSYPNSAQYLSYFKSVAQEVANRGMKLVIEIGVPLLNRGSSLSSFILPSFCPYESDWKQVAQTIIDNLSPYYMTIFNEPSTMYEATHYTQFDPHNGPQNALNFITYVLGSSPDPACPANAVTPLRKGSTKIGAGQGNWDSTSYAQGYAQIAGLDAIDLHVYPLVETAQHPFIQNILDVASYARQAGKKLTMTEMWDNKEQASDLATSSLSGTPAIFSRDVFSFWQPTDRLLIAEMVQFARTNPVDYISPFWSLYFEAYLTYTPGSADETTSSYALDSQVLHLQVANLTANGPATQSGMAYQALISSTVGITPVPTPESMATMTPLVPTRAATSTPLSPTNTTTATPLLPTRTTTPTVTPLPTGTAIPTATATRTATPPPVAATATRTATPLPPTLTATATAALTATVTSTPVPATRTATPVVALATAASVVVTAVPGKVVAGHTSPPPKGGGHVPTTLPHLPRTGGGGAAMGGARGWIPIGALLLGLLALVAALARRRASYSRRC